MTPKIWCQCYILQASFRLISCLLFYKMSFLASILEWRHHACHHWWRHDVAPPRTIWNDQSVVGCKKIHDSKFSTIYRSPKLWCQATLDQPQLKKLTDWSLKLWCTSSIRSLAAEAGDSLITESGVAISIRSVATEEGDRQMTLRKVTGRWLKVWWQSSLKQFPMRKVTDRWLKMWWQSSLDQFWGRWQMDDWKCDDNLH